MGNNHKIIQHQQNRQEENIIIRHQKFSNFKYLVDQDLLQINIDVPGQKQLKIWQKDITSSIESFQSKQILFLPVKYQYEPKGWCGNTGSIKIYYQNFPYLFSEELQNRIKMSKYFEEEELWYLLYSLISSAKDFYTLQKKIGDIRPNTIFINEDGQIKISNVFSWPYEKTNFQKTVFQQQLTYISPEQMILIQQGNHENTTNIYLSQSFSIGVTLLETGLLCNMKQIYSIQNNIIDIRKLHDRLKNWMNLKFIGDNSQSKCYSPLLKHIISSLCQIDPLKRQLSLHIEQLLNPYQNQIMNLKQFDKTNIKFNPSFKQMPSPLKQQLDKLCPPPPPPLSAKIAQQNHPHHPIIYRHQTPQRIVNGQHLAYSNIVNPPIQQFYQPVVQQKVTNIQPQIKQYINNSPVRLHHNSNLMNSHNPRSHNYLLINQSPSKLNYNDKLYINKERQNINYQFNPIFTPLRTLDYGGSHANPANYNINNNIMNSDKPAIKQYSFTPSLLSNPHFSNYQPQKIADKTDFLRRIDEKLQNSRRNFPSN